MNRKCFGDLFHCFVNGKPFTVANLKSGGICPNCKREILPTEHGLLEHVIDYTPRVTVQANGLGIVNLDYEPFKEKPNAPADPVVCDATGQPHTTTGAPCR